MPTIFTKIVNGEIPCHKIAETEDFFAFLDIRPLKKGHTLVIPKQEVNYIFDLTDDLYVGLNIFAREIARAVEKTCPCKRIAVAVVGLEVPHAHIHLVPLDSISELNFENPRIEMTAEEMAKLALDIRANLA
ncbi:MAG: HIT family protein [Bacteroidia bacterium]|nr:HIT family protein [Bacteroidia bacterium]